MSTRATPLLILVASLASTASHADNCSASLDEILARYVEARGGAEALEKQTALRIISSQHEGEYNPEFDYRVMKPGYMWIRASYKDGFIYTEGFDGKRGWEKPGDEPASYVGGDAARALNQGAMSPVHLYGLHHMEGLGADVTFQGCESIEGSDYYVINVVSTFGSDIDYYVNRDTYRLERGRSVRPLHPTEDPTPIAIEERWGDFRSIRGVLHPFAYSQWNVATNERLNWLEILEIIPYDDATPANFAKPD